MRGTEPADAASPSTAEFKSLDSDGAGARRRGQPPQMIDYDAESDDFDRAVSDSATNELYKQEDRASR